jgi:hypothetical protein
LSSSNWNFAGYTGSKNLVQTKQKFQFIKLDFSNSIFQNPSADRYRDGVLSRLVLGILDMGLACSVLNGHFRPVYLLHVSKNDDEEHCFLR